VVGTNIRRLRKSLGLSQEGLAELSGLHWTCVGSVERGERNVSVDNICRLADALGADVRDLFEPLPAEVKRGRSGGQPVRARPRHQVERPRARARD
jgi:transcriptional regulator with XRE-family HTH domain